MTIEVSGILIPPPEPPPPPPVLFPELLEPPDPDVVPAPEPVPLPLGVGDGLLGVGVVRVIGRLGVGRDTGTLGVDSVGGEGRTGGLTVGVIRSVGDGSSPARASTWDAATPERLIKVAEPTTATTGSASR